AHQFSPAWSSDGRRIAFLGSKAPLAAPFRSDEVYLVNPDGSAVEKITGAPGAYASPVWMPRRRELYYAANTFPSPKTGGPSQTSSILFRYVDGTRETLPLLTLSGRIITAIEPSPDGSR